MGNDIIFSTNPSDWPLLEGVYVNRLKPSGQVKGRSIDKCVIVASTLFGPDLAEVGDPNEAEAMFGGRDSGGGGAVVGNSWKAMTGVQFSYPLVISRAKAAAAVVATASAPNATPTQIIRVDAASVGTWANDANGYGVSFDIADATDGVANHFDLLVHYRGATIRYKNFNTYTSQDDNCSAAVGSSKLRKINVTKLAAGRPVNTTTSIALASGTDGVIASSDYVTALDRGARYAGVRIVVVPEIAVDTTGQGVVNARALTLAAELPLTTFCLWSGAAGDLTTEVTEKTGDIATPAHNVVWCANADRVFDNTAQAYMTNGSHVLMASILSQTDADVNPGVDDAKVYAAGIKSVINESVSNGTLKALKAAGIACLEKTEDGFQFKSGVATDGSEIADNRVMQYLTEAFAYALRKDVKQTQTNTRRRSIPGKIIAFAQGLQRAERMIAPDDDEAGPAIKVGWTDTFEQRSQNMAMLYIGIRTLPHFNSIVLGIDIGTGVITASKVVSAQ